MDNKEVMTLLIRLYVYFNLSEMDLEEGQSLS